MRGRIKDLGFGLQGDLTVTLTLPRQYTDDIKKLLDADIDAEIKKWREKRSLSANAYAWVLITKIAQCTRPPMSKEAVYKEMLKSYGQVGVISVLTTKSEPVKRELKYWESAGTGTVDGKEFEHIRFWVGSSLYDKHEMGLFIDGIVSECKGLDIETLTPHELERMKGEWA
jgi:hypothetical protein